MNKKAKAFLFIIFICVFSSFSVLAYNYLGLGQWASGNVNYAIVSEDSSYVAPITDAASMWTNNSHYKLTRNNSSRINVYIKNYGKTKWDGSTEINGQSTPPIQSAYSYAHVKINTYHTTSYDSLRRKLVVCHELGHAASLDHVTDKYTMMYANDVWIAYQNNRSLANAPAKDDIDGINNRY